MPSGSRPVCAKPRSTISATAVLDSGPISTRSAWAKKGSAWSEKSVRIVEG